VVPTFKSFGMSQNVAELYLEMNEGFASGRIHPEGKGETIRGKVGIEEGLRELAGA
jgi:hypothetical protein